MTRQIKNISIYIDVLGLTASTQAHWIVYAQCIVNSLYCLMNGVSNWDISQCSVVNSTQTVKYNDCLKIVLKNISPHAIQMGIQTTISKTQRKFYLRKSKLVKICKYENKQKWENSTFATGSWVERLTTEESFTIKRLKEVKKQPAHMIL